MLDQFDICDKENIIHQLIKVQAQVKVTPLVKHGVPKIHCIDSCIKPHSDCHDYDCDCHDYDCSDYDCDCADGSDHDCNFTLTQIICVEVPISFDVDVDVKKGILCCGEPYIKPDCKYDCEDDVKKQIFVLLSNKIQF